MGWRTTMRRAGARLALGLVSILAPATAVPALTLYQISGSGDVSIAVDGSLYLDQGGGSFDAAMLSSTTLSLGLPLPTADEVVALSGLEGYSASFTGDVVLQIVDWGGGTLSAAATDTLHLVGLDFPVLEPGGCDDSGGVVVSTGELEAPECLDGGTIEGGATIEIVDLPGVEVIVPEPSGALLFAVGLVLVRARRLR